MKAAAPGKLVVSGAYAVLEGAPAVVTAVDRYAVADSDRPATFITEEVKAAGLEPPPWFDATQLRDGDHKLGLGSSAAIVVASLGTAESELPETPSADDPIVARVFHRALRAHQQAQGGGSGIDVAAASFGGTLAATSKRGRAAHRTDQLAGRVVRTRVVRGLLGENSENAIAGPGPYPRPGTQRSSALSRPRLPTRWPGCGMAMSNACWAASTRNGAG